MISDFLVYLLTVIAAYSILVASLNLAIGFTGLVNLGHMVFFGIGAYASAILTVNGMPWYFAMPIAALLACIAGTLIAAITVRLKGDYFQIVTIGFVFMAIAVSRNWISLTRGALGIPGVPKILSDNPYYMLFSWAIAGFSLFFLYKLVNSETGKIFQAIRDDETAAAVLGKNTYFYKVLSIAISTFFAGLAGSLYVHYVNFIDPTIFDLGFFILILSMLFTGGLASIKGSVVGVFSLSILTELVKYVPISDELVGAFRVMLFIVVMILILIFKPRGIFGKVDV